MKKKMKFGLFLSFFILSIFFTPQVNGGGLQDDVTGQLQAGATPGYGAKAQDPRTVAAQVIKVALGLVGMLCMALIVMSGYWYLTSQGDDSKVEEAQSTIRNAIIGLFVIILAYSLTVFISRKTQDALKPGSGMPVLDRTLQEANTIRNGPN